MAEPIRYQPEPGGVTYTIAPEDLPNVPEAFLRDPRFAAATRAAGIAGRVTPTGEVYSEQVSVPGGVIPGAVPTPSSGDMVALPVEAPGRVIPGAVPTPSAAPSQPPPVVADGAGSGPLGQVQRLITGAAPAIRPGQFTLAPGQQSVVWRPGMEPPQPPPRPAINVAEELARRAPTAANTLVWTPGEGVAPSAPARELPAVTGVPATTGSYRMEAVGAPSASGTQRLPGRPAGVVPAAQREMERAAQEQQAAIAEAGVIGERTEAARQRSLDLRAQEARRAEAEQRTLADAQRQAAEKAEGDYRLALADLRTPAGEINPRRWWQNADTGQRIAAGVAAFLSGLSGGRNPVEDIINRDIAAQQDQLERMTASRREQVQGRLNLLGAMRARFGDEQAALAATKAAAFEAAAAEADRWVAQAAEGTAKNAAMERAAVLRQQGAMAMTELQQRQAQTAAINAQAALERAKLAGLRAGGKTEKQMERTVFTPYGELMAANKEQANKLSAATESYRNLAMYADRMLQLREEYGSESLPTQALQEMQELRNRTLVELKNRMGMGASFTADEQRLVEAFSGGDPSRIGPGVLAGFRRFRSRIEDEYENIVRTTTGFEPFAGGRPKGSEPMQVRGAPSVSMEMVPRVVPGRGPSVPATERREPEVRGIPAIQLPRGTR